MFGMEVIPEAKLLTLYCANHFNQVRGSSSQAFGAVARAYDCPSLIDNGPKTLIMVPS